MPLASEPHGTQWQVPFPVPLRILRRAVSVPCYRNRGPTWDVRQKVRTWVCWTPPFPGLYRCCPLPNDGGRFWGSSVTGQGGSRASWGSFAGVRVACRWAAGWSCVRWLCWLIWNRILWCFPYLSRNFEALWGGNPFKFFFCEKIW